MSEGLQWRSGGLQLQQGLTTGMGELAAAVWEGLLFNSFGGCHHPDHRAHSPEGWIALGPKTTREGAPPHPSADNWLKALQSKACFTSKTQFFPPPVISNQEAYTNLLPSSIRGQTEEARTTIPQLKQKHFTES